MGIRDRDGRDGPLVDEEKEKPRIEWENKMKQNHFEVKKVDIVTTNRRVHDNNFGKTNRITEFQDYAKILHQRLKNKPV